MRADLPGQPGYELPALENIVLPAFEAVARQEGESLEVALQGELDMAAAFRLEPELERWLRTHDARRLVLDLAELTFVDSAGLGALLSIRDRAEDLGIEM